jgi:hypothetical protein
MATLEINGRDVEVDDIFLSLTPEQQNATVEEIAASLGAAPKGLQGKPGKMDPVQGGVSENVVRADGRPVAPVAPAFKPDLMTATAATVNGLVNSVPFLQNTSDAIMGAGGMLLGQDYGKTVEDLRAKRGAIAKASPVARVAGEIGGTIGGLGLLGKTVAGAEALGLTGGLGKQVLNSGLSSAGLTGLNSISSGREGVEVLGDMAAGGALGAGTPLAMAGLKMAGRGINDAVIRPIATMANRDNEAIGRVGRAVAQDTAAGSVMSQADEAVAASANAAVLNADRFGTAVRTLARTASNVSTEAQGALKGAVEDRFLTQGARAKGFVDKLMGGATDDLALQDTLRTAAQTANKAAYDAARSNPASRAIWNQPIKELMQSDTFQQAIRLAESRGSDKAAISGFKAVKNPFEFRPDGSVTLKVNADGSRALPSLDFWDQVKRNLDSMIDKAKPTAVGGGDRALYSDLTQIKQKLVGALDAAVPEYQKARQGAAAFFGAEDAIDAGRKAFRMTKEVPELRRAHFAMTPAEKEAASIGYSSELIDAIDAAKDRVNVINSLFGSPSARARNELFLGSQRAKELEAYVKVEQTLHMLKDAVSGNSTTAQQLIAAGVLGGAGGFLTGGDLGSAGGMAFLAMAGRRGLQMMGKKVDDQVMKKVAEMLTSSDPAMVKRAIQNAAMSKQHMEALDAIMRGLTVGTRGAALSAVGN